MKIPENQYCAAGEPVLEEPVTTDSIEAICFLSSMQEGILFHSLTSDSDVYFCQTVYSIEGGLDAETFERAWRQVLRRHSILRTAFAWKELERPLQVIFREAWMRIQTEDWRGLSPSDQEQKLEQYLKVDRKKGFNLGEAPLLRLGLLRAEEEYWHLVFSFHHLLLDGWSKILVLKEVKAYYDAYLERINLKLPEPRPYREYLNWLEKQDLGEAEAWWRRRLRGFTTPTPLPLTGSIRAVAAESLEHQQEELRLSLEESEALQLLARQQQVTLNTLVQGAWGLLLSRHSGERDVVFGVTVAGRNPRLVGVESMVGLFINTLPVRMKFHAGESVGGWLKRVQREQAEAYGYDYTPLVEIQKWSEVERGAPLFESLYVFENYSTDSFEERYGEKLENTSKHEESFRARYDRSFDAVNYALELLVIPTEQLLLRIMFHAGRFREGAAEQMLAQLRMILLSMAADIKQSVNAVRWMSETERCQVVEKWNGTEKAIPQRCMHELFEEQAARTPEAVAVEHEEQELTYRELNQRANQLAGYLQKGGVGPEVRVGIYLDRTETLVVGFLAVLKAGGVYVPLDPNYPVDRLNFMIEETGLEVVLTSSELAHAWPDSQISTIKLDQDWEIIAQEGSSNLPVNITPGNLAYVIYTSGSTGKPKGAQIEHRGMLNHLAAKISDLQLTAQDVVAETAPSSFDISVWQMLAVLLTGGRVRMIDGDIARDAFQLLNEMQRTGVTVLETVPALLQMMVEGHDGIPVELPELRWMISNAEALPVSLCEIWKRKYPGIPLMNAYGPTECSDDISHYVVSGLEEGIPYAPLGRPLMNTKMYVVDEEMEPVPVGVAGELYIGGTGVGRGYVNQAGVTAECFVPNPFSAGSGERLYRTGDVVRQRPDGTLDFIGRRDHQVKIRGFRVELGEIETALLAHEGVKQAVVVAREDEPGEKRLVAYVVGEEKEGEGSGQMELDGSELRRQLRERLPEYMVPSAYVQMEEMPLNANGKVDRKRLPAPEGVATGGQEQKVRMVEEEILCGIWEQVLKVERVGVEENFFEIGGHSLLATQVVSRIRGAFGVELPLRILFERPTVAGLAEAVKQARGEEGGRKVAGLVRVEKGGELPLSYAQQRLWFLEQMEPGNAVYNVPLALRIRGELDREALVESMRGIVERHEVLRTVFVWNGEQELVQRVLSVEEAGVVVEVKELGEMGGEQGEAEARREAGVEAGKGFNLKTGPLLRVKLLGMGEQDHVLLVTMHHIVSDGWSIGILVREFMALYEGYVTGREPELEELAIQYGDYAAWQREWLGGGELQEQMKYWKEQLGGVEGMELGTDHVRPAVMSHGGATVEVEWGEELTRRVRGLCRREGVTLFMALLGGLQVLLGRYAGKEEVVVGTPIANRTREEIEPLIGFFVNTLVLRGEVRREWSIREMLKRVREVTLAAYGHQDVPFEQLVEELQPERDLSRNPLFDVMLIVQNAPQERISLAGLSVEGLGTEGEVAKFDLTFSAEESGGKIRVGINYARELYERGTIERMMGHFRAVMEEMSRNAEGRIGEVRMLSEEERAQLEGWNGTEREYGGGWVQELFEEQVKRRPEAIAVEYEEERLNYEELNRRCNQLGHYLRRLGVGPEVRVGLCMERSLEMVVAIMGVLKAGGAYVPLDPSYPAERLSYMLEDTQAAVLLTQAGLQEKLQSYRGQIIHVDGEWERISSYSAANPECEVSGENLAYVIYTSGSTGQPKGVGIRHASAMVLMQWGREVFSEEELSGVLAGTSVCFDLSVFEILVPLSWGGKVILAGNALELLRMGDRQQVKLVNTVPSVMRELVRRQGVPESVVTVNLAGEALQAELVRQVYGMEGVRRVLNLYGPSEDTTYSTYAWIGQEEAEAEGKAGVSIGRPVANRAVYVLDEEMELVPVGVAGELYIGGAGLARGYVNQAGVTAERFVPNPFARRGGERLYQTGDRARWRSDGNLEYLGRLDQQVKVRGYRIELGEIEATLQKQEGVREAVVVAREDEPGEKRLVAYVVGEEKEGEGSGQMELDGSELRRQLRERLPEYMVPSAYVQMEEMPLNANGKVDRKRLPAPEGNAYAVRGYQAPVGEVEQKLASVWAEVLKVERVGRQDNFFVLGGHSLLAITVIERMRDSGLAVDVRTLFAHSTLADLAAAILSHPAETVEVPPNRIPTPCQMITPDMVSLMELTAEEIEQIVGQVPGGAVNVQDIYPLAPLQEGIFFHHLMGKGESDPYVLGALLRFDTRARLDGYIEAIQKVVDRHDILRTAVLWEGLSQPVQVVQRRARLEVEEVEVEEDGKEKTWQDAGQQLYERFHPRRYRMDVRRAPLLRLHVGRDQQDGRWLMMLLLHHLAGDHSTLDVMRDEVLAQLEERGVELPVPLPFRNLVAQARLGVSQQEHERFFRQMLGDVDEPTAPFGLLDVQGDGSGIEEARLNLDSDLAQRLRSNARRLGVSAASVCHVAWALVLAKVSGRQDVVFGTVLFGRMQGGEGRERVMGLFINTLPMRIVIGEEGVEASVRRTHILLADLLRHEHASLALAQRCSAVPAPAPLFSALLNYRHSRNVAQASSNEAEEEWQGVRGLRVEERNNYPFTLSVDDMGEGFALTARTPASVGPMRVCEFVSTTLAALVAALEWAPATAVSTLEVLPAAERHQLLHQWNDTRTEFPAGKWVHKLFEEQVKRRPEAIAVEYEEERLNYEELNRQANQLAHYLRKLGVGPDARVALCMERSLEMVISIMAVLKAGGAYVPLDPAYPAERLRFMLQDSAPVTLLTQSSLEELFDGVNDVLPILDLSEGPSRWQDLPATNLDPASTGLTPQHLAYIIYTSGSTGMPKGVMIEHRNLLNYLLWSEQSYYQEAGRGSPAIHSIGFDGLVTTLFGPLLTGQVLTLLRRGSEIEQIFQQSSLAPYTLVKVTPSHLKLLNREVTSAGITQPPARTLMVGGEALVAPDIYFWQQKFPDVRLINHFGPTEATVGCSTFEITTSLREASSVPIGRPIANTQIYILDKNGNPVPVGVAGELYIGGAGVARGYLNRADLTAEKFVADPFAGESGARMYRTGDLARWRSDGNIEFLGRNDFQVKIRSFRIELGEIEARLAEYPGVGEAIVMIREDTPGDKYLVAYYTGAMPPPENSAESTVTGEREKDIPGAEALRRHLSAALPEYMVPKAYVWLDSLPLTPNGKLDRKALPAPQTDAYAMRGYETPLGETETILAGIWAEVLKFDRVGRHDNFFQLGGHSLLAVTVVELARRKGLKVDVRTLFATSTLAELAASIDAKAFEVKIPPNRISIGSAAITPEMLPLVELTHGEIEKIVSSVVNGVANVQDIYPLAPLQEGILFHHLLGGEGDPYLQAALFSFETRGVLDAYVNALNAVIVRHDILRTAVLWEGMAEPVQVVLRQAPLPVDEMELDPNAGDVATQLYERLSPRHYRIDVRQAPLLRLYVAYDREKDRWLAMLLRHHLVGDHSTLDVMRDEVLAQLEGRGEELPVPPPFRNLVAQARLGVSQQEHERFFRQMLGDVDEPTAPFGLLDVQGDGSGIEEARLNLDSDLAQRLRSNARRLGVSAASVCHVAWALVLAKVSGRQDVVFGTVLFGRMQGGEGRERVMGLFINTLPMRIVIGEEGVEASVRRTHILLADLLRHEHASLALAQRCSAVPAPAPLFSALLNYRHSRNVAQAEINGKRTGRVWEGMELERAEERTSYPFTLSVDDMGEGFRLTAQTVDGVGAERVSRYMERALNSMVEALEKEPEKAVKSITVLSEEEWRRVVYEWNRTEKVYSDEKCVHELFEEQVERRPEAEAVRFGSEALTYGELNRRANQLAHYLRKLGVGPEVPVGICVERSLEMVIGLLGILKAGGAYVSLDPAYPHERLAYMLQDSAPAVLLTQKHLRGLFPEWDVLMSQLPRLDLGQEVPLWRNEPETNMEKMSLGLASGNRAYVIYTSGSTGQPKGVMVEHRNIVRLCTATQGWFDFNHEDVWTVFHSYAFDFSVWEIWGALLYGGRLVVVSRDTARSAKDFYELLLQERVTVLNQTPSAFRQLIAAQADSGKPHQLRYVVLGGEALEVATLKPWYRQNSEGGRQVTRLINMYGITETTVHVTYRPLQAADTERHGGSPIGGRIPDLKTYILDGQGEPAPIGVAGELYVGGAGVARGYMNRPDLSGERFLPDPFGEAEGARMYRTGDLGRWLEDGHIEFLGRNDFQVKIRGYRIELGEIEAALQEHVGVREAVVLAREKESGETQLVAYWVGGSKGEGESDREMGSRLRQHIRERLPEYMVPSAYVQMEEMPLNANGKVDRKRLPAPEGVATGGQEQKVRMVEEEILCGIWEQVLKVERVGVEENFFEIGGHSLLATQVVSRIRGAFGVELPLRILFERPTVAGLAEAVKQARGEEGGRKVAGLVRVEKGGELPLSYAQQRLWFLEQMEPGNAVYNVPLALRIRGELDREALVESMRGIVERHEVLRTVFVWNGEQELVQRVLSVEEAGVVVEVKELGEMGGEQGEAEARREAGVEAGKGFNLKTGPLLRVKLLGMGEQDHVLLVTMHHIVSDGWSIGILVREFMALYEGYVTGREPELEELAIQYGDYAAWQREWLGGGELQEQMKYWKEQLGGVEGMELGTDHVRPAVMSHGGATVEVEWGEELTRGVRGLCRREGVTLFMALLGGLQVLLGRYAGKEEVVVGTPIANRTREEIEPLIGFFVNTLVLRGEVRREWSIREMLKRVREVTLAAYGHQDVPFEQLVEELQPERDLSRNPLFDVMLIVQNAPQERISLAGLSVEGLGTEGEVAKFDLTFSAEESGGKIRVGINYARELYERGTIERMMGHFRAVMEEMSRNAEGRIGEVRMLSEEERAQLEGWNGTEREYGGGWVQELFEEQVKRRPEAIAVEYEEERLNYEELNRRCNQLGHYLRRLGVGPEVRVGLCMERSLEMVVAIMGVLKAGGAYVPLDPSYPAERLSYMLEDTQAAVLLTQAGLQEKLQSYRGQIIHVDGEWERISSYSAANPECEVSGENLAYVIYTSGSTGQPKGAMNTHGGLSNRVQWMQQAYGLTAADRVLQKTPYGFDVSVWEFMWPLMVGARLVMLRPGGHQDPGCIAEAIRDKQITTLHFVPAMLRAFLAYGGGRESGSLRRIICSGEALDRGLARECQEEIGAELHNLYGPTEASIDVTFWECRELSDVVMIGRPIANTQIHVLDSELQPVPVGVAGELYIGGAGLARGYVNQAGVTAERFVPNPFARRGGERLYQTGDRARWRSDGNLEYLGRLDQQVKIRGYRIELGEIEATLQKQEGVREAVVVAREDEPGEKRLVAYVVGEEKEGEGSGQMELDGSELRRQLRERLPEYMVPSAYVQMEEMPLNANGKVDRKRLPATQVRGERGEYEEPRSGAERILAGIWEQVLRIERVGRRDKFFELGGDSILSIKVATRAAEAGLEVTMQQIFQKQTLAELAGVAGGGGKREKGGKNRKKGEQQEVAGGAGKSVRARGKVPLTAIQEWFFEQELDEMEHFNQGMILKVKTGVRGEQVRKTVRAVLDHHEAVGLRYRRGEGGRWEQWYEDEQIVGSGGGVGWEEVDMRGMKEEEQRRVMESKAEEVQKGMNLERGPLARGVYFEKGEGEQGRLLLVLHHLIVDGVSWRILLEDVERGLRQMELVGEVVELRESDTMQRWVEAVRGWVEGGELEREEGGYWLKLEEVDAIERLPRDYEGGENRVEGRGKLGRELSEEETKILLREGPKRLQAHMQEILLAGLAEAVGKWNGERGVLVGIEGHGREGIVEGVDAKRTLGWFTSLYPVWLPMRKGLEGLEEQVRRVKEVMGGIPRKGIGYGLLRYLSKNEELRERLKGLPQPEILFNYFGQWDGGEGKEGGGWLSLADEGVGECQSGKQKRGHLFEVTAVVVKGKLNVGWNYGRELHRRETVEGLIDRFMETLRSIAKLCRPDIEESHQVRFPMARLKAEQLRAIVEKVERAHQAK